MKKQQRVHSNDLLVAEIDAKVGGFGIVPSELEGAIVSSHYFVYAIDTNRLLPEYLEFYLKTGKPTKDLHTQGFVKGSLNYASIRPNDFLELKIPWASPEIQRRIVALFRKVEELASTNSKKTEMLNALMRSVLDRFLSEAAPEQSSTSFSRREERRDIETATTMNR
jgi:type I restriction enzyme S subunit